MKSNQQSSPYQRVQLDGKWFAILPEADLLHLMEHGPNTRKMDTLDQMTISDERLAQRLIERRTKAGLSQKELAELADVRVETLNRIEKGKTTPDFKTIRKLVTTITQHVES
ncbi:MAG: helix-turn-helix domain-containing protein [Phycisphaeraceae bacterium JB051]